jgi:hypothetical protein
VSEDDTDDGHPSVTWTLRLPAVVVAKREARLLKEARDRRSADRWMTSIAKQTRITTGTVRRCRAKRS